ncbi:transglutaminase family protein [Dokdonella soli]|uniref:Transglutaminase family protein n=1 Tax=Dokdonella soli TaxID=529810 RepID=A0ABN1ICM4_9GAMM
MRGLLAVVLSVVVSTVGARNTHSPQLATFPRDIQKVLSLPEDQIDTGLAALTFAKEIYPYIDVAAYSSKIDELAEGARQFIARHGKHAPDSVIRALDSYYYKVWGVQYDKAPNGRATQENYFINGILDRKLGQCVTIPMLYMAIAQRLGYPVYAVVAPEHNFVRFVDPTLREQNIELSGSAGYSSDAEYAYKLNISQRAIQSGAYLRTLTRRQYLCQLLQQNAIVFATRGDLDRAIFYFEKAYEIDSKDVYAAKNLAMLYHRKGERATTEAQAERCRLNSNRYHVIAEELGWTSDPDANTRGSR